MLTPKLMQLYAHSYTHASLPPTTRSSVISLLHKKKEKDNIKNYRPLSLTNNDYKILSKALQIRMNPTMNHELEQRKEVNPLKDLAKAVITRACLDSLGHITNSSYCGTTEKSILMDTAKRFFDPNCFERIFLTPANSNTVRIELPAITPDPGAEGLKISFAAPNRPFIV